MRSKLKVLVAVFLMAAMVFTMFPASAIAGPKGKGNRKPGVTVEETQAPETEVVETEAPTEEVETETVIETEAVTPVSVIVEIPWIPRSFKNRGIILTATFRSSPEYEFIVFVIRSSVS